MALASCIAIPHRGVLPRLLWRVEDALDAWQLARLLFLCDEKPRAKRDVRTPREYRQTHKAGPHL